MRAVFMGTPEIAVASLNALSGISEIVGVVCQPDRPAGRGLVLAPPPVKTRALELGLDVVQPAKVRGPEFLAWLRDRQPDVAVVLAYGRILPPDVLQAPKHRCLNLHASILPHYRGAAPIQWAIVRGETQTGVSLMQMEAGLDTGPVYATRTLSIGADETAGELAARLALVAAEVVRRDIPKVLDGSLASVSQNDSEATLAPLLKKEDGRLAFGLDAESVHNHVRGMSPWPGAFTQVGPRVLKVLSTRVAAIDPGSASPGTVIAADTSGVIVACGRGAVEILKGQLEGKKPVLGRDLVNGRLLAIGTVLG